MLTPALALKLGLTGISPDMSEGWASGSIAHPVARCQEIVNNAHTLDIPRSCVGPQVVDNRRILPGVDAQPLTHLFRLDGRVALVTGRQALSDGRSHSALLVRDAGRDPMQGKPEEFPLDIVSSIAGASSLARGNPPVDTRVGTSPGAS
jgi:hypothetical protein